MQKHRIRPVSRGAALLAALAGSACALLGAHAALADDPPRTKYGPQAVRLQDDPAYVREQPAPDFWVPFPYYLPQPTDSACSTTSVAMLVNGLRAKRALRADEKLVTPEGLLERTGSAAWAQAVRSGGDGVSLDQLGARIEQSLAAYELRGWRVEVVHTDSDAAPALERLRAALAENERSSDDLIVANFLQSELTGDPDGAVGHMSPIGAYDALRRRVLVLDPDRTWYEPYWVSDTALLRAMSTRDVAGGGLARGFVWVRRAGGKPE